MIPVIIPGSSPALTYVVAAIAVVALVFAIRGYWKRGGRP